MLCTFILKADCLTDTSSNGAQMLLLPGWSCQKSSCWSCSRTGCCSCPDRRRVPWQFSPGAPSESQLGTESGIETEKTTSLMRSSGCSRKTAPSLVPPFLAQVTASKYKSKNLKRKRDRRHSVQLVLQKQNSPVIQQETPNIISQCFQIAENFRSAQIYTMHCCWGSLQAIFCIVKSQHRRC